MLDRAQSHFASVVLAVAILSVVVFMVLVFYMPKWVAHWTSLGHALPLWKVWLAKLSISAQAHQRVLWVVLGLGLVSSVAWWVVARTRCEGSRGG